jgi:hypothetical protein
MPPDPISAIGASAASGHELFMTYHRAGFTRDEALQIYIAILLHSLDSED